MQKDCNALQKMQGIAVFSSSAKVPGGKANLIVISIFSVRGPNGVVINSS
jgi:hypothetical protein